MTTVVPGASTWAAKSGDLDSSFGEGGVVTTDFGVEAGQSRHDFDVVHEVIVQKDSKILAVGTSYYDALVSFDPDSDFAMARYNPDGSLDQDFAAGGKHLHDSGYQEGLYAAALQEDGKIVAGGSGIARKNPGQGFADALVQRYLANGLPDPQFGSAGMVELSFQPEVSSGTKVGAIGVQADGKILASGAAGSQRPGFIVRLAPDGSHDVDFGNQGTVRVPFPQIVALSIDPESKKILVAGSHGAIGAEDFALARFNTNGTLDSSFGEGGWLRKDLGGAVDNANTMVVDKDRKILVAGVSDGRLALARFNPNGALDSTFAQSGLAVQPIETARDKGYFATAIGLDSDGRLVVGAGVGEIPPVGPNTSGGNSDFVLLRYRPDGTLDPSFGEGGMLVTDIAEGDSVRALAIQPDRAIVAAGSNGVDFAVAKYLDPQADLSVTKSVSADRVTEGETATFTVRVGNSGPAAAEQVRMSDPIPAGFVPSSVQSSQGSCTVEAGAVNCSLGELASSKNADVTIQGTAANAGTISNTASVSTSTPDPNVSNNADTAVVQVLDRAGAPPGGAPPVTLSGISPDCGPTSGGTEVNIHGTNLGQTTGVRFGDLDLPTGAVTVISDDHIKAVSPAHPPGSVQISVETPEGLAPSQLRFTFPCNQIVKPLEEEGLRAGVSAASSQKALAVPPGGGGAFSAPGKAVIFAAAPLPEPGLIGSPGNVVQSASPHEAASTILAPGTGSDAVSPNPGFPPVVQSGSDNAPASAQRHAMTPLSPSTASLLFFGGGAALLAAFAAAGRMTYPEQRRQAVCFISH